MITTICWGFIVIFSIFLGTLVGLLLADPDPMGIFCAISIILIGALTLVILILTMPI